MISINRVNKIVHYHLVVILGVLQWFCRSFAGFHEGSWSFVRFLGVSQGFLEFCGDFVEVLQMFFLGFAGVSPGFSLSFLVLHTYRYFTRARPGFIGVKWSKLVQKVGSTYKTMVLQV